LANDAHGRELTFKLAVLETDSVPIFAVNVHALTPLVEGVTSNVKTPEAPRAIVLVCWALTAASRQESLPVTLESCPETDTLALICPLIDAWPVLPRKEETVKRGIIPVAFRNCGVMMNSRLLMPITGSALRIMPPVLDNDSVLTQAGFGRVEGSTGRE